MKSKITSSLLNRLPFATAGKSYYVMDTELPGFALRVHTTTIQFVVRYRRAPYVIGPARSHEGDNTPGHGGVFTVRQARERARDLLIDLWSGKALRRRRRGPSHPSIRNLFDEYFHQHAPKKRASSVKMDRVHWKKILSYFPGTLDVASLATTEIVRWHQQMADTPAAANRALGVLCKALNLAEVWGWIPRGSNPTKGIGKFPEHTSLSAHSWRQVSAGFASFVRRLRSAPTATRLSC